MLVAAYMLKSLLLQQDTTQNLLYPASSVVCRTYYTQVCGVIAADMLMFVTGIAAHMVANRVMSCEYHACMHGVV